jgi:hypothetical protein
MSSVRVDQVCLRSRALFQEFDMAVSVDDRRKSKLGRATAPK